LDGHSPPAEDQRALRKQCHTLGRGNQGPVPAFPQIIASGDVRGMNSVDVARIATAFALSRDRGTGTRSA
jgi:hypothetical protein